MIRGDLQTRIAERVAEIFISTNGRFTPADEEIALSMGTAWAILERLKEHRDEIRRFLMEKTKIPQSAKTLIDDLKKENPHVTGDEFAEQLVILRSEGVIGESNGFYCFERYT